MPDTAPSADSQKSFRFVASDLRRRLQNKEWKEGAHLPSLRQLAVQYDVGLKTIRLAINELRREGMLTMTRAHRLLARETQQEWIPTPKPILMVLGGSLSRLLQSYYARDFLDGLFEGIERNNHALLLFQGRPARRQQPLDLIDRPLQGVVLFGMLSATAVSHYQDLSCPVVLADRPIAVRNVHRVLVDNIDAAYRATERLLGAGHSRLALAFQAEPDARERKLGFLAALTHHGKPRSSQAILNARADPDENQKALRRLFFGRKRCTAALATGSYEAEWLSKELASMGLKVPGDVSLVSFQAKTHAPPRFSGQSIDFKEMGRQTYALLHEPKAPPRLVRITCQWVDGGSLSAPRA